MKPCENQWIEINVSSIPALNVQPSTYIFEEKIDEMVLNGFGVAVKSGKIDESGKEYLGEHAFTFQRLFQQFGVAAGETQQKAALQLIDNLTETDYISFLQKYGADAAQIFKTFTNSQGSDPFGVIAAGNNFTSKIQGQNWKSASMAHGNFIRKANAYLSYLDKAGGDVADIIQTLRWFKDLVRRGDNFKNSELAQKSILQVDEFITKYGERNLFNKDYPQFVKDNIELWKELLKKHLPNNNFDVFFTRLTNNLSDPKRLQKSHCELLMELTKYVIL